MATLEAVAPRPPIRAGDRLLVATSPAVRDRASHDWGPWSPLVHTGVEESLEQRVCGACGHEQITASDCLRVWPRRPGAVSAARPAAVAS